MIKGVVFDLDATLSDRKRVLCEIGNKFYKQNRCLLCKDISCEYFIEMLCKSDLLKNHYGWQSMGEWLFENGVLKDKKYWEPLFDFVHEYYKTVGFAEKDAEYVLSELKNRGYALGIITNGLRSVQGAKLKLLNFDKYISEIIICEKVRKPAKQPFVEMADRLGLNTEELIYVGDNPVNDIEGARAAGYTPVWMKKYALWNFPEIKRCKYEISSLSELLNILE